MPYCLKNIPQLMRKRHIGNDIVTIVFQDENALPFDPSSFRSQFQHLFIVVRVLDAGTDTASYMYEIDSTCMILIAL